MSTSGIDRQGSAAAAADDAESGKASLTVNIDERVVAAVRERAARNRHSIDTEVFLILLRVIGANNLPGSSARQDSSKSLAEEIHELFADVGGIKRGELEPLPRGQMREPPKPE